MITSFRKRAIVVTRAAAYTGILHGRIIPGDQSNFTIKASVQMPGGDIMKMFPEGRKSNSVRVLYTDIKLQTADEQNTIIADEVFVDGFTYVVFDVEPWQNGMLDHYRIVVQKK